MAEDTKPLTEAQQQHLTRLNAVFLQARQRMDEFIAYLRAEHDAPANEWQLQNLQVGFERMRDPQEKSAPRRRGPRKPKAEAAEERPSPA